MIIEKQYSPGSLIITLAEVATSNYIPTEAVIIWRDNIPKVQIYCVRNNLLNRNRNLKYATKKIVKS